MLTVHQSRAKNDQRLDQKWTVRCLSLSLFVSSSTYIIIIDYVRSTLGLNLSIDVKFLDGYVCVFNTLAHHLDNLFLSTMFIHNYQKR